MDRVRITGIGISIEHNNVRELAHLQRADLIFRNGLALCSETLSRGQVKTVSACWALACSVFLGGKIGHQPALLFDEIGADWDSTTLLSFISRAAQFGGQVVGTSSNWEYNGWEEASSSHNAALFHVEQGKIGVRYDSATQGA